MKLTGLTALCTAIGLIGIYFLNTNRRRLEIIKCISDFFRELSVMSSLVSFNVIGVTQRIGKMKRFSILSFPAELQKLSYPGCNVREIWCKAFLCSCEYSVLGNECRELMLSFSDSLGNLSAEEFSLKCKEYSLLFEKQYDDAKKDALNKHSLMAGVGILGAAAVFIILI